MTISTLSDIDNSTGYIWLVLTAWYIYNPYLFAFDIDRIKFTFQRWRNLSNRILNGRTLIVINFGTDYSVVIIYSNKDITTCCVGKGSYLFGYFFDLRWHTAFEVYIIAFTTFNQFLYLRCR